MGLMGREVSPGGDSIGMLICGRRGDNVGTHLRLTRTVGCLQGKSVLIICGFSHLKHSLDSLLGVVSRLRRGKMSVRSLGSGVSASSASNGLVVRVFTDLTRFRHSLVIRHARTKHGTTVTGNGGVKEPGLGQRAGTGTAMSLCGGNVAVSRVRGRLNVGSGSSVCEFLHVRNVRPAEGPRVYGGG